MLTSVSSVSLFEADTRSMLLSSRVLPKQRFSAGINSASSVSLFPSCCCLNDEKNQPVYYQPHSLADYDHATFSVHSASYYPPGMFQHAMMLTAWRIGGARVPVHVW